MSFLKAQVPQGIVLTLTLAYLFGAFFVYTNEQFFWSHITERTLEDRITKVENLLHASEATLKATKDENAALAATLQNQQAESNNLAYQFQNVASTVGTLEKLSKTDRELLKKYSKVYFLNENYIPLQLTAIDQQYLTTTNKGKTLEFHSDAYPFLTKLFQAALHDGVTLQVVSAYRSFGTQSALKASYIFLYGAGTANSFSADQGYSEHQLGTTVDLTTPEIGTTALTLDKTQAYQWLTNNAYRYGFVLSYPKSNTYYQYEPWHWRFVGIALATLLHNQSKYFYDLDQRVIDQYLAGIFDQ